MDMFKDIVVCTDKNNDICSMGININSEIAKNNPVFILNKKNINNKNNKNKKNFKENLGVPISLYLLNNEYRKLSDIINIEPEKKSIKKNKQKEESIACIDNDLFDKLLNLANNNKMKNMAKTKKNKKKRKKRKHNTTKKSSK